MVMRKGPFTVRRMMVSVAILAVLFAAWAEVPKLWIRRRLYLDLAERYHQWEQRRLWVISIKQEITYYSPNLPRGPEPSPARLAQMKVEADHYGRLRAKYERAARYPWRAVEPDPPPPQR